MVARRTPALLWCAALLVVPTILAGVSTVWPGAPALTTAAASAAVSDDMGVAGGTDVATAAAPVTDPSAVVEQQRDGSAPTARPPTTGRLPVAEQVAAVVSAAPVRFAADSAALEGAAGDTVRAVAALLAPAGAAVELTGHVADTPGSPEGAQALSERRAVAVADALVAGGVDRARITTVGRGAAEPSETRAASRRVEFEIR